MLKKEITYTAFDGEEVVDTFYFNYTKAELVEMEVSHEDGMEEWLEKIVAVNDRKSIVAEFKSILGGAIGQRSADGKLFIKNDQIREEFESSEAYSVLFMELVTDAEKAAEFVNGIMPQDLVDQVKAEVAKMEAARTPEDSVSEPGPKIVTTEDIRAMDAEEFAQYQKDLAAGKVVLRDN